MNRIIILLPSIVLAYDMICPHRSQRQLRRQGFCVKENIMNSTYICLEDVISNTFIESCLEEEDFVRPGRRYVYQGQTTTSSECSTDRYQPIKLYKTSGDFCIFVKDTCSEVGQVIGSKGSDKHDTTCTCNYKEGYSYVTEPADVYNCVPAEEDCACYKKLCPENNTISSDNECIHTNTISITKYVTVNKTGKNVSTTVITDSTANLAETEAHDIFTPKMITVLVIFCVLILLVCMWYKMWIKINKYTEDFPATEIHLTCQEGVDHVCGRVHFQLEDLTATEVGLTCQKGVDHVCKRVQLCNIWTPRLKYKDNLCAQLGLHFNLIDATCLNNNNILARSLKYKDNLCAQLDEDCKIERLLKWLKCDVITSEKNIIRKQGKYLRIRNTNPDDDEEYIKHTSVQPSELTVPDCLRVKCSTVICEMGANVLLRCCKYKDNVRAQLDVDYKIVRLLKWLKCDVITSEKNIIRKQGKYLRIRLCNTNPDDDEEYIKNTSVQPSELTVPEHFTNTLDSQACMEGDDYQNSRWSKDRSEVSTSDKHTLERNGTLRRRVVYNTSTDDQEKYCH